MLELISLTLGSVIENFIGESQLEFWSHARMCSPRKIFFDEAVVQVGDPEGSQVVQLVADQHPEDPHDLLLGVQVVDSQAVVQVGDPEGDLPFQSRAQLVADQHPEDPHDLLPGVQLVDSQAVVQAGDPEGLLQLYSQGAQLVADQQAEDPRDLLVAVQQVADCALLVGCTEMQQAQLISARVHLTL